MSLEHDLARWDGKSSDAIEQTYRVYSHGDAFVPQLIAFTQQLSLQKGASWLLKHHLDRNGRLTAAEIAKLFRSLSTFRHWETKLHMLQCIPRMPIGESEKRLVESFLRQCLSDRNKFLRAWAYNGFYELSRQYPEYEAETKILFEMAMKDEAPSVRARIRNIAKTGF